MYAQNLLQDSVIILVFGAAAWGVGKYIRKRLGDGLMGLEGTLSSLALGLGVYAMAIFAVGTLRLLYREVLLICLAGGLLLCVKPFSATIQKLKVSEEDKDGKNKITYVDIILIALLINISLVVFIGVLMPEIFYDALYYHDAFDAVYLIRHRIEIFPYAANSAMPSNVDILYIPALCFGDAGTVKLCHFAFYIGTCLWVYSIGNRYFGSRAGLCGAVLFASLPGAGQMAGMGAVDLGVSFFALGSFAMLSRWLFEERRAGILAQSAILVGTTVGSKYTALQVGFVAAVGAIVGAFNREGFSKKAFKDILFFGAISLAVALPFYLRNLIVFHNPLYPALELPGSAGNFAYLNLRKDSSALYPLLETFWKLPADVIRENGPFGSGSSIWPAALIIFAGFVWGIFRKGFARWAALGILLLYVLWARSVLIVRFFLPALALGAALTGGLLFGERNRNRRLVIIPAALAVIFISLIGINRLMLFEEIYYYGAVRYLVSGKTPTEYLARFAPHSVAAGWVSQNTPLAGTKLLMIGETEGYYYGRDYEPISAYDRHPLNIWLKEVKNPEELKILLRTKGFTHIIWNQFEIERLNKKYGHCKFTEDENRILGGLLAQSRLLFDSGWVKVYSLE